MVSPRMYIQPLQKDLDTIHQYINVITEDACKLVPDYIANYIAAWVIISCSYGK